MIKNCQQCNSQFEITDEALKAYDQLSPVFDGRKFNIPAPKMCPLCRQQRRLAFRNERKLYTRKCDLSGRQILSIYSPDKPYKVYDQSEWWSDKWDAMDYGRDYDFKRGFFEQFRELYLGVPRVSLHTINVENSYYTCYTLFCKNCYLLFGGGNNEDVMFGKYVSFSKNCLDSLCLYSSEFCYQGVASDDPAKIFVEAVKEMKEEEELQMARDQLKLEREEKMFDFFERRKKTLVAIPGVIFVGLLALFLVVWELETSVIVF